MGLFTDGDGIPLAFFLFPGNQNEQTSLKPLEKKVIEDFGCDRFIFCSDATREKEGSLSPSLLKNSQLNTERQRLIEKDSGDYQMESWWT